MAVPMSLLPKPAAAPFTSFRPSVAPPGPSRRPSCYLSLSVSCGPRDNRGPLVRGRTLSTEAILAVQALKRAAGDAAAAATRVDEVVSRTLARLIKSDLLAALAELQRQGHCVLALKVFVAMRGELWYRSDYAQYAQMVAALARNGMATEIDDLVADLLEEVQREEIDGNVDMRGLARLLKALIAAGKGKAVKDVYRGMKRRGIAGDEYLFKFLGKGLRRLGEGEAADEVDRDHAVWCENGGRLGASAVRGEQLYCLQLSCFRMQSQSVPTNLWLSSTNAYLARSKDGSVGFSMDSAGSETKTYRFWFRPVLDVAGGCETAISVPL
ncbi:hypothetical protein Taro_012056 [Colocasia esculenta]|uniref:Uncharacterized protein n=1 Tax=Colocasia esculenta TaxID=4460 RepID=A0A843UHY1_COLES|nr:hypothetical protein [Colocasia esculenta]